MNKQDLLLMLVIVGIMSIGTFIILLKNKSKNMDGIIASGGVSIIIIIGLILISIFLLLS